MLIALLPAVVFAADPVSPAPVLRGSEDGSLLVFETEGGERRYDFAGEVHLPDRVGAAASVSLRFTDAAITPGFDRIVSSWAVRAEATDGTGDDGILSGWIAVLEPERTRLAGFSVDEVPTDVSVSDDGRFVTWADASGAHVRAIEPPPRPRVVLPPDVDPPLFVSEPVLWTDLDIVDFGLGGPDVSLELFDIDDWIEPISEEADEVVLGPGEVFWGEQPPVGPGAQRLVSEVMELPLPEGEGEVVATLGRHGRALAVARGSEVAVWTVGSHVKEPIWTGSLPERIVKLTLVEDPSATGQARATLASGEVVDLEVDAPWTRQAPDPFEN